MIVIEQTMNAMEYLNIIVNKLHPHMASAFQIENGMLQQDNAWTALEWFQKYDAELHLISWPLSSLDLNLIEHICDGLEWQLRVPIPPSRNILDLHDYCLNIWYNLSLAIYQGLVHPCQGGLQLCCGPKMGQLVIDRWL